MRGMSAGWKLVSSPGSLVVGQTAWRHGALWLGPAVTEHQWPPDPASNPQWAFNQALRQLGVDRCEALDEFYALNLGKNHFGLGRSSAAELLTLVDELLAEADRWADVLCLSGQVACACGKPSRPHCLDVRTQSSARPPIRERIDDLQPSSALGWCAAGRAPTACASASLARLGPRLSATSHADKQQRRSA
jgi:hypothetical protein